MKSFSTESTSGIINEIASKVEAELKGLLPDSSSFVPGPARRSEAIEDSQSRAAETPRAGELSLQIVELFGLCLSARLVGKRELTAFGEPLAELARLGGIVALTVDDAAVFSRAM